MDQALSLPPRSLLFVPASRPRMIAKAAGLAADWIILDLEDAVREDEKAAARAGLGDALATLGDRPVGVRINPLDGGHAAADLAVLATIDPVLIVVPKVEDAAAIAPLDGSGTLQSWRGAATCTWIPAAWSTTDLQESRLRTHITPSRSSWPATVR